MTWLQQFIAEERARLVRDADEGYTDAMLTPRRRLLDRLEETERRTRLSEREYTVEEAAERTGMHPTVIRRGVQAGRWGTQAGKKHRIAIKESELTLLAARTRRKKASPCLTHGQPLPYNTDTEAARLLKKARR
jgi:hypothetical protein